MTVIFWRKIRYVLESLKTFSKLVYTSRLTKFENIEWIPTFLISDWLWVLFDLLNASFIFKVESRLKNTDQKLLISEAEETKWKIIHMIVKIFFGLLSHPWQTHPLPIKHFHSPINYDVKHIMHTWACIFY